MKVSRLGRNSMIFYEVYPSDVGNLHVIDYYLHLQIKAAFPLGVCNRPAPRFDPSDWTRYDGDLL